jgi:hypothetical protein
MAALTVILGVTNLVQALSVLVQHAEVRHLIVPGGLPPGSGPQAVSDWLRGKLVRRELQYFRDGVFDRWQSPSATLVRRGGDCEDLTILAASLIRWDCGSDAYFVFGTHNGQGHAWLEGYDRLGWFLIESTSGLLHRHRPAAYVAVGNVMVSSALALAS